MNLVNTLVQQKGALKLVQIVAGPSALTSQVNGSFTYGVDCGLGSSATGTQTIVIHGGAPGDITFAAVQANASFSITQFTTAPAPSGSVWGPPSYAASISPAPTAARPVAGPALSFPTAVAGITVTIPPNGTATVTITNGLAAQAAPEAVVPAPLSRMWLLLFVGSELLLTGIYFQRRFRD